MKENKYRGKRSYDKQWVYGSLLIDCDGDFHIIESKVVEKDGHHIQIDSDFPMFFDNDTIGQFTGLHDKNGVEIYDRDIVLFHTEKGIVKWDIDRYMIEWEDKNCNYRDDLGFWCDKRHCEVIGNIHESEDK